MNIRIVRSALIVGLLIGIGLLVYGFLYGLCGTFGPTRISSCPDYTSYELIDITITLICLAGLFVSFLWKPHQPRLNRAGIKIEGENKWLTLIQNASRGRESVV